MSGIVKAVGVVILLIVLTVILRELGFRSVRLISLVGSVGILTACVFSIESLMDVYGTLGGGGEYAVTVMKIIGIGYVSGICSDVCIEFGEITLSNSILLFGKAEMLILSAPCAVSVIEKGIGMIQ